MARSYLDNLQRELGQLKDAARGTTKPKTGKPNANGQDSYKKALGQTIGALVGKQYNDKTGKRIK